MRPTRFVICAAVLSAITLSACSREGAPTEGTELPTLDVTHWTDKTELFMEYPPLVAGRAALFAVHLTKLDARSTRKRAFIAGRSQESTSTRSPT